jgi:DNA adenine methylase
MSKSTCDKLVQEKKSAKQKPKIKLIVETDDDDNVKLVGTFNKDIKISKPLLKWVGGKTQILDKLIIEFPQQINNYHEIFLGGGSVLLAVLAYVKAGVINIAGNICAYDLNETLIYLYKNVQTNHNELYDEIQKIISEYNECSGTEKNNKPQTIMEAKLSKENYYYWMRQEYNKLTKLEKQSIIGSAIFLFINKTCWRGVFRESQRKCEFNVPYGNYVNPEIINKEHLDEIHTLLQGVIFECCDFAKSLDNIKTNDFVYLDPPYAPQTDELFDKADKSFVSYTKDGFGKEQHNKLFELCNKLCDENKKMMMSNADVNLVRHHFSIDKFNINSILCKRHINSKNPESKAKEVIIKNY